MRIQDYCAGNGCLYRDYFSAMVGPKGSRKADLSDDGLHPNALGYARMAPLTQRAIQQALAAH